MQPCWQHDRFSCRRHCLLAGRSDCLAAQTGLKSGDGPLGAVKRVGEVVGQGSAAVIVRVPVRRVAIVRL
jgi:hypothetical protein